MNIPRKKKKKIPVGMYCYTPIDLPSAKTNWIFKTKCCPFYKSVAGLEGYCRLIKGEVMDQVKECGERYGFED